VPTNLSGVTVLASATEGTVIPVGTTVATFTDSNNGDTAADFTATIDWGDGTTTTGVVTGGGGAFAVLGGYTYADEGSFTAIATLTHTADNVTGTATGTIAVAEGDIFVPTPVTVHVNPNQAFSGAVGTFTDTNLNQVASDFTAAINWGDGTTSVGTVVGGGGGFTVVGTHTYAAVGQNIVTATVSDDAPGTATATAVSTAVVGFPGMPTPIVVAERVSIRPGTMVATFTDGDSSDTPANFTATINWGDGTTAAGVVTGGGGVFTILTLGHTYADEGTFTAITTLTHTADGAQGTASGVITAIEFDILRPQPTTVFHVTPNQLFSGAVGTFTDTDRSQVASDFTAVINWGDGTTSVGTVVGGDGGFTITGAHTYAAAGQDIVTATLRDDAPGTATATAVSTALVGFPGQLVLTTATEDSAILPGTAIATFTDGDLTDTAASFAATIDWGDGTTTTGTIVGAAGSFAVDGGHTYAVEGNFQATATLTRTADNVKGIASGQIAVAEGPTIPDDFSGSGLSGVLWRQSTTETFVQWSMNGSSVTSSQSNTYFDKPVLPDASWNEVGTGDFNGDGKTDILWQNSDGSLADWTMNGSIIADSDYLKSQGQIATPNSSWSLAGTGDFNGDAHDDLLWRNTNGSLVEWLMNQSTITSSQTVTSQGKAATPDSSWSVVAMGDFDGDGHQDILWRNTNGSLAEWLMNGSIITSSQSPTYQGKAVVPDASWSVVAVGDFNGDGGSDLLWRQCGTGLLAEWQMNGTQITSSQFVKYQGNPATPDSSWSLVEIGDFNGDGKSDILWRQSGTGALAQWMIDGSQITSSNAVTFQAGQLMPDASWQVQNSPTDFV
jgi:FG-GAP-like repeat/FG-GAP repeat